jgi:hypothetical protein
MGQTTIPGTSVQYSNPQQVDQNSLVFPPGTGQGTTTNAVAGHIWEQNFAMAIPQPGSFDATKPQANPIIFRNPA